MKVCPTCQRTYVDDITFCTNDGTRLQQAYDLLPAGHRFHGKYEIETFIKETASARLYRARHILLGEFVALKIFKAELLRDVPAWREQLERDLQAARRFRHPNVVTVYDFTADFMVMEWIEGKPLDRVLRERGRFTPQEAAEVLAPVGSVLEAASALGIVCEFLTPADIMLEQTKDYRPFVKLLPLIFNRRFGESDTGRRLFRRTVKNAAGAAYLAPELWTDDKPPELDERALVYSLGVIAHEMLTGRKPYDAQAAYDKPPEQATAQLIPLTELVTDVPPSLARLVERALDGDARDRPATAGKFVSEFKVALGIERTSTEHSPLQSPGSTLNVSAGAASSSSRSGGDLQTRSAESRRPDADATPVTSAEAAVAEKPIHLDENVQFTVYQPERIAPARWYTLLAFAHLSKRREDAPPDEPEPLAEVKRIAERVLADQPAEYDASKQNSQHAVPRAGEITFVPEMAGCEFNPPRQSFSWQKSVHKVEFELRAAQRLEGQVARGRLTVFLGSLILADVPLVVRVDSAAAGVSSQRESQPAVPQSVSPYRKIFPSYSHKDRTVVEQIEQHVHALGDKYLRDVTELRAGQDWQRWMRDAIREADVFQLFWSHNSMRSVYVREEWEYALSLGRPNFVRPTYWEFPLPESPTENLPPDELRRLHFQYLQSSNVAQHPAYVEDDAPAAEEQQERAAPGDEAVASTPVEREVGREVSCRACGSRNSAEYAFCLTCGAALDTRAHSPVQAGSATATAQQTEDALDVFWQKQQSEQGRFSPSPSQSMPMPMSPPAPASQGRPPVLIALVGCLFFLIVLAFGLYLLIYLL